eukprot:1629179-Prymnesium_polylepis.1
MHELELALALSSALSLPANDVVHSMLSAKAERLGLWPLAASLLRRTRDSSQVGRDEGKAAIAGEG